MGTPTPTFYVFHGQDEFTIAETLADFKRRLGPPEVVELNTVVLDGNTITLARLQEEGDALPFLADRRLVIVKGLLTRVAADKRYLRGLVDYLPGLPPTTRMVFVEDRPLSSRHPVVRLAAEEPRGYVKRFDRPGKKALPRWVEKRVRKHGGAIEGAAAAYLAEAVGANLRLLDQEIVKLVTYTNGERAITRTDVERLVPYAKSIVVFDMVDALGRRDGRTAARTLHRLLDEGEHPLRLLAMVVRQFRLLIQVKELRNAGASTRDVAERLHLHPYPAEKLCHQATYFTGAQLKRVYRRLLETDEAVKTGQMEADVALDVLVAGLCA